MSDKPANADRAQLWAALDSCNERLVDATHPLLAQLRKDRQDTDLPTAKAS
jgi:hypothetical protein